MIELAPVLLEMQTPQPLDVGDAVRVLHPLCPVAVLPVEVQDLVGSLQHRMRDGAP